MTKQRVLDYKAQQSGISWRTHIRVSILQSAHVHTLIALDQIQ
jgi:hypothetical protein